MGQMSMRVILKSGADFIVKCDAFTLEKNGMGQYTGYDIKGITENKPTYINFDEVAAIVRILSDEQEIRQWKMNKTTSSQEFYP